MQDKTDYEYIDELLTEEEKSGFKINNDEMADWAVGKLIESKDELDRLLDLADSKIETLLYKKKELTDKHNQNSLFLNSALYDYFQTVTPSRKTKTKTTYNLLSGNLVLKNQAPEFEMDKEIMLTWVKKNLPQYIKADEKVLWAEFKKQTQVQNDELVYSETGEIVPGVHVKYRDDIFNIEK